MKKIVEYLRDYFLNIDKKTLILSTIFLAVAIFINYHFGLEKKVVRLPFWQKSIAWFLIFFTAFSIPYLLSFLFGKKIIINRWFLLLLFLGPVIFAWKISSTINFNFYSNQLDNKFWNQIVYWPFKLLVVSVCIWVIWKLLEKREPFYGFNTKNFEIKPYWLMLLLMVPLVASASTQKDFLAVYPKLKNIEFYLEYHNTWWNKLLFELAYGTDFFSIELFFRGFLVLAFVRWAGKEAILPMAVFYCTIHFGKPLGECISSYFGGIILGVITYNTQTIIGGLMVHLGIAWMMELGGYVGKIVFQN